MEKSKNLKVTIKLKDGRLMSANGLIMLDAIIYHAWFFKHAPEVLDGAKKEKFNGYIGLPFKQENGNIYHASKGIYEEIDQEIVYINKRPNFFNSDKIQYLNQTKGKIDEKCGSYRAYRMPQVVRILKNGEIVFFCCGKEKKISEYLSLMPSIGKKYSIGFGIIENFNIEETEKDWSFVHPKYGLMRPIEVNDGTKNDIDKTKYPIMMFATHPPYWKQINFKLCYVPI